MTSYKDHQLDLLGINSQYEADEFERDLDIRFDRFTYLDREVWVQQNSYLDAYAHNGVVSDAADVAGISVLTAQAWQDLDTLGFNRRLEMADLRFSDSIQVMALDRVRQPNAPASLLITLLRAHIPKKYSANGHTCETSKADDLLSRYRQNARGEIEAGQPFLQSIIDDSHQSPTRHTGGGRYPENAASTDESSSPTSSHPSTSSPSPVVGENWGEGELPHPNLSPAGQYTPHSNLSPAGQDTPHSNLPPAGRETSHSDLSPGGGDTSHSDLSPTQEPTRHTGGGRYPENAASTDESPSPVVGENSGEGEPPHPKNPAPGAQKPTPRLIASLFQRHRRPRHDDPNILKVTRF